MQDPTFPDTQDLAYSSPIRNHKVKVPYYSQHVARPILLLYSSSAASINPTSILMLH